MEGHGYLSCSLPCTGPHNTEQVTLHHKEPHVWNQEQVTEVKTRKHASLGGNLQVPRSGACLKLSRDGRSSPTPQSPAYLGLKLLVDVTCKATEKRPE